MGGGGVAYTGDLLGNPFTQPGAGAQRGRRTDGHELRDVQGRPHRVEHHAYAPRGVLRLDAEQERLRAPVPAFGWATSINENVTVGLGGLGIGGFGFDYAQDNTNPVLGPRQMGGFGQVYSNFSLLKITLAISFAATDKLQLGFALNIDWASLAVDPMPVASSAWDPNTGTAPLIPGHGG